MHLHLCSRHYFFTLIIFTSTNLPGFNCFNQTQFSKCSQTFNCGLIGNLSYPFWGDNRPPYCGQPEFKIDCHDHVPIMNITSQKYRIIAMEPKKHMLRVVRADFGDEDDICSSRLANTSINVTLFKYAPATSYLTLFYGCNLSFPIFGNIMPHSFCRTNGTLVNVFFSSRKFAPHKGCKKVIRVPILEAPPPSQEIGLTYIQQALHYGFELQWKVDDYKCNNCIKSGGQCGWDRKRKSFTCFCSDKAYGSECLTRTGTAGHASMKSLYEILAASISAVGIGMLIILVIYFKIRRSKNNEILEVSMLKKKQEVEALLRHCGISGPKRYTYTDLKRFTNSLKDKIGGGGYGIVYRGKLHNGQAVAVKVLKNSKGDPAEFINEVASIGTTNHKNVVKLLGFCYDGRKRALVYDFMPNGSLEKFIYGRDSHQSLAWEKIFGIVVGVARGLEYLHQGCNTRILHFDIKPHNILLDENFCPKISDFGLAKSCKESIISISGARGTVGYIAPEVFLRGFGGVSQKSDVYSYGMLVLDMVGCRNNSDAKDECSSEQYFPHWIYKQLEQEEGLNPQEISTDEERKMWRKMVLVSLWCIQTSPQSRPTTTRVVEMLEGNSESLQIPPVPTLTSPPRSPSRQNSSSNLTVSIS